MAMNTALMLSVADRLESFSHPYNPDDWSRCMAGHTLRVLHQLDDEVDLLERFGGEDGIRDAATEALGLTDEQAHHLFIGIGATATNATAIYMLRLLASVAS